MIAGASDTAGLNEPPESGPNTVAAVKMNRPMKIGAWMPFHGAFLSVATAEMTIRNSAVAISSMISALPDETPEPRLRGSRFGALSNVPMPS